MRKKSSEKLGKDSFAKFSAYLSACKLWDTHGTTKRGLINPTRPQGEQDSDGFVIHPETGNRIYDKRGRPIKDRYHTDAIRQLPRGDNPNADRYPILSFHDLALACGFSREKVDADRNYRKRAKLYWKSLEEQGIVRIKEYSKGWQILPSESHTQKYRAMRRAIKASRSFQK